MNKNSPGIQFLIFFSESILTKTWVPKQLQVQLLHSFSFCIGSDTWHWHQTLLLDSTLNLNELKPKERLHKLFN